MGEQAAVALGLVFVPEWSQKRASARAAVKTDGRVITAQTKALGKKINEFPAYFRQQKISEIPSRPSLPQSPTKALPI